jgi:branched-chain amino acid transport system permease protein
MSADNQTATKASQAERPAARVEDPVATRWSGARVRAIARRWWPMLVVLVALTPPFVLTPGKVYVATGFLVAILFAVATGFVIGFAGVPTFGQQAFYAAGAYITATLVVRWHWTDQLMLLGAAMLVGVVIAIPIALLMRGTAGLAFGLLTLAIAQAIYLFVYQTPYVYGEAGLSGAYRGEIFGIPTEPPTNYYLYTLGAVVVCVGAMLALRKSMVGRVMWAIRENHQRVSSLGVPVGRYRIVAFAIGAVFCAAAGSLLAQLVQAVDPSLFYWTAGANPILASLIGGIRTVWGPILGSLILQSVTYFVGQASPAWVFWLGTIVVTLYLVWPDGILVGLASPETRRWFTRSQARIRRITGGTRKSNV